MLINELLPKNSKLVLIILQQKYKISLALPVTSKKTFFDLYLLRCYMLCSHIFNTPNHCKFGLRNSWWCHQHFVF